MNFETYQNLTSSEKVVLATIDGSKRLMGWTLHSGSIYKIQNLDFKVLVSIYDSGTAYTSVGSIGAVTASKYYFDVANQTLYLRTTGSDNPNSRFIVATFRFHFANVPIVLPHDLNTGSELLWEPWIKASSEFGVEIDTINQTSEAIEGSGSITLINDHDFWPSNYDKLIFENKPCVIYSYHRDLAPSDAKVLFKGKVQNRTYKTDTIVFNLKDTLAELASSVSLPYIQDLAERNAEDMNLAFQRMIFGRVSGFRPTNIDEVQTGYPLTGTVSITSATTQLTGSSTLFNEELSPGDRITLDGENYTIDYIVSNTSAYITEAYAGQTLSGESIVVIPDLPKRWMNRVWNLSSHALREPVTTALLNDTTNQLWLTSTADMYPGDKIYVGTLGSGELVTIDRVVSDTLLFLSTSLLVPAAEGTTVTRPAVQNVRMNDLELRFYRDYTVDAANGTLTLTNTAEANVSPVKTLTIDLTFTNGSRVVTGTGLDAVIKPGYMVSCAGQADFFEVMSVSETELTLRTAATFSDTDTGKYKPFTFDPENDVLSCDILGRTDDGLTTGNLLRTGPEIVQTLLTDLGLSSDLDTASFTSAIDKCPQDVAIVIPERFDDKNAPKYRDVINQVNKSILGSLIQTDGFLISYLVIQPTKDSASLRLREADILDFSFDNNGQNLVKTAIVEYLNKEYDYLTGKESVQRSQKTSDFSTYLVQNGKEKVFSTNLIDTTDAGILANRWSFILEQSAGSIKVKTKLQGASVEVGDVIDIEHRKLFVRFGGTDTRRLVMVEKVTKNGSVVSIEGVDLSNAFNRCANITSNTAADYSSASDTEKLLNGYITDTYGMQSNDPDTFGLNLIW